MRGRQSEYGHHRVADELLDRPAVGLDALAGDRVVARQDAPHLLRVELLAKRSRTRYIGEQDCDNATFFGRDSHRNR